jgi:hypothetical protein
MSVEPRNQNELSTKQAKDPDTLVLKQSDTLDLSALSTDAKAEITKKVVEGHADLHLDAARSAQELQRLQAELSVQNNAAADASIKGNVSKQSGQVGNTKYTIENNVSSAKTVQIILIIAAVIIALAVINAVK